MDGVLKKCLLVSLSLFLSHQKKPKLSSSVFSALLHQGQAAACAILILKPLFFLSFTLANTSSPACLLSVNDDDDDDDEYIIEKNDDENVCLLDDDVGGFNAFNNNTNERTTERRRKTNDD